MGLCDGVPVCDNIGTMEKSRPTAQEFTPSDKEVSATDLFEQAQAIEAEQKAEESTEGTVTEKLKRELSDLEGEAGSATGDTREKIQKDIDAIRNELGQKEEAPKEQTGKTVDEATKNARIDEIKAEIQQEEIKKEFEALPEADKEKVKLGLQNVGFYVEENKNRFFAKLFQGTRMAGIASGMLKEKGSLDRFLGALGENAEKDAELSRKRFEDAERTSLTQTASIGTTIGNIAKYGRIIGDIAGWTAAAPLRYAMMGSMLFGTGSGAVKEARFKNEEVLEKTRLQDINTAAEEAWKIYEQTEAEKETVSKEDLVKAYQASVPKDLLARLQKDPEPGTASGILQGFIKSRVESSVKKINGKIEEIEQDKNLSEIDKKVKQEKILNKYSKHLNDLDRAVSRFGTVDALALGAKYTETGAKHAVTALTVETLAFSIYKLWENLPSIMETANEYLGEQFTTEGSDIPTEYQEGKRFPMGERPEEILAPAPVSGKLGEVEESFIVQKGEGIEHAFIRQLSDDPEKFGFAGDSKDDEAVMDWAGKEAHRIAIKAGYVDLETGNEVRVGGKGGDIAYELAKDSSGSFKINEYIKDSEGNFKGIETNEVAKDLESAQFETDRESHEYEYEKPEEQTTTPAPEAPIKESLIVPESTDTEQPVSVPDAEYQTLDDRAKATGGPTISEESKVEYAINMPKKIGTEQMLGVVTRQTNSDIDKLFGTKGFIGIGGTKGVASPDWNDPKVGFKDIPAKDILDKDLSLYEKTGQKNLGVGIENSGSVEKTQNYLNSVIDSTGVKPNQGEKTGDYLTRALMEKINRGPIAPEQPVSMPDAEYQTLEERAEATGGPTISEEPEIPKERIEQKVEHAVNMPSIDHEQLLTIKTQQINNDLDKMFGSRGIFGLGKTSGVDSPDWKNPQVGFANKTVEEVMGTTSGRPRVEKYGRGLERNFGIKSSAATKDMKEYLTKIFNETKIKPETGEKTGEYITRALTEKIKK